MSLNKIKNFLLCIFSLTIIIWLVICINSILNYSSVKIVDSLDEYEYKLICDEYYLDYEKANIEYIYSAGGGPYGVRLLLNESDLKDMNILFTEKMLNEEYSNYYEIKSFGIGTSILSDGIKREVTRLELSELINEKHNGFVVYCFVFTIDNRYYMEIETQKTENIKIYNK